MRVLQLLSVLLFLPCSNALSQDKPPNILIILTDDQRWDAMGIMGNTHIQTPHMDQLARESATFMNAFVTTPICAASRASIMTGQYERTHGFTFGTSPLSSEIIETSYPALLKEAGYQLGFFGKFGMSFEDNAENQLFDAFYNATTSGYHRLRGPGWGEHVHLTDLTTDKAIQFIDTLDETQPFCVSISFNAPHADDTNPRQYIWPERNDSLYQDTVLPATPLSDSEFHNNLPGILRDSMYMGNIRYKWRYDTPEKADQMIKGYYRMITTIDQNLGRLREFLKLKGYDKNTVIIFLGDNGYFLGERQLAGKWLLYDNSIHIPMIIHDPTAQSRTVEDLALNIDVSPTVLSYAGIPVPPNVQGKDLLPTVKEGRPVDREDFLCEHLYDIPYIPKSEGVRTRDYKYFRYPGTGIEELYHLESDPMEVNNLINSPDHREVRTTLRKRTDELIRSAGK
jgi:arylsulfatase A-like enzyme